MKKTAQCLCVILMVTSISVCSFADNPVVVLETNLGTMSIELYPQAAPVTVDNFLRYVNHGFYDNLVFHRGIKDFMIQAGAYYIEGNYIYPSHADPNKVTYSPIINESGNGLSNLRGTVAMARTNDPNSATSQFYINHKDNLFLDKANAADHVGYCVFGKVIGGLAVVDVIANVQTAYINASLSDFPVNPPVVISRAYVSPCDSSYCSNFAADTRINIKDYAQFATQWLENNCNSANGFCGGIDLDYSETVDLFDLELFIDHWTRSIGYEPKFSDLVKDNKIDTLDLTQLLTHWLENNCSTSNNYCGGADLNRSGTVDLQDISLFAQNWLKTL